MAERKRSCEILRKTSETSVKIKLNLDGGDIRISTKIGFLDHMCELFAKHGGFGLEIDASGDTQVDYHHSAEDIGIVLGQAFYEAAGDKKGINRYGHSLIPMDESLTETVCDFGGRIYFNWKSEFPTEKIGNFDSELIEEFWRAFCYNAKVNLHIITHYGSNSHHIAESIFKSAARSISESLKITGKGIMSTKGIF